MSDRFEDIVLMNAVAPAMKALVIGKKKRMLKIQSNSFVEIL